jgi:hypothetical protein
LARITGPRVGAARLDYDARQIFMQAEQFHNACRLLGRFAARFNRNVSIPSMICSAFALELYLKCLIILAGRKAPHIHNRENLFKLVDSDNQEKIRKFFKTQEADMSNFFNEANRQTGDEMMPSHPDFDKQLKASADAFQLFRHLHEPLRKKDNHPTGYFAYPIEEGARHAILLAHPEWEDARIVTI